MGRTWRGAAWCGAALGLFAAAGALGWRNGRVSLADSERLSERAPVSEETRGGAVVSHAHLPGIRADLFGGAEPIPPPVPAAVPPKARPVPATPVSTPGPDPLDKYHVTGIAEMDGERYACVENRETKVGEWVRAGQPVGDATVRAVEKGGIVLESAAGEKRLALNDRFDLVPLDRDAAYLGGRVTRHDGQEANFEARTGARVVQLNDLKLASNRIYVVGENFKELANQAFEGKIDLQEYHDRVNGAGVSQLRLSYDIAPLTNADVKLGGIVFEVNR